MGSVDVEKVNIPHRSKIDNQRSPLEEMYAPMIPSTTDLVVPEGVP